METIATITREHLTRAGWHIGRQVDVGEYEEALRAIDIDLHDPARVFLQEFGGLKIFVPPLPGAEALNPDWIVLDPIRAITNTAVEWFGEYRQLIGRAVCPIGVAHTEHAVLLMDDRGWVFGAFDSELWEEGTSGLIAINGMCTHYRYGR